MRYACYIVLTCLFVAVASGEPTPAPAEVPAPAELLAEVLAQFPATTVHIEGRLWKGKYPRAPESNLRLEANVLLGGDKIRADYTIRTPDGKSLDRLEVRRDRGEAAEMTFFRGDPPVRTDMPPLTSAVAGLDISWLDLTMSFLWWRDARSAGSGTVRGRDCFVLDVTPPVEETGCGPVRVWIDTEARILLQAEERDSEGAPLRRMLVKSFKKVDGKWMIKDIEVKNLHDMSLTTLRVDKAVENDAQSGK